MKRRVFYITLLVAVLGALAWLVLRSREPTYEGKSLTYWLEEYTQTAMVQFGKESKNEEAARVVRQIGASAVPTLLRLVRAKDTPLSVKLDALIRKQRLVKSPFVSARHRHSLADAGFALLGEEAKSAVPGLIRIYRQNDSEDSRRTAANAFRLIGPAAKEAVPALLEGLARTNLPMGANENAIEALGEIHSHPELVVPVLLKCLNDGDQNIRRLALYSISSFGPDARMAVPELLAEATNSDSSLRDPAMAALGKIHSEPGTVLPVLMRGLYDTDPSTRRTAAEALTRFGPDAKAVIPELITAFHDGNEDTRGLAASALMIIDRKAAAEAGVK